MNICVVIRPQHIHNFGLLSLLDQLRTKMADKRQPGEKQYQDTGDLFFLYTSLTRYLLRVLKCSKTSPAQSITNIVSVFPELRWSAHWT